MLTWIDKGSSRNNFIKMFVFSLNNLYNIKKNRMKVYRMITYNSLLALFASNVVYGMVLLQGQLYIRIIYAL